jgi:hypothetical protein
VSTLNKLGYSEKDVSIPGMYWSNSKSNFLLISDMATQHIRNALLLEYKTWTEDLRSLDNSAFMDSILKGPGTNTVIQSLAQELNNRQEKGIL